MEEDETRERRKKGGSDYQKGWEGEGKKVVVKVSEGKILEESWWTRTTKNIIKFRMRKQKNNDERIGKIRKRKRGTGKSIKLRKKRKINIINRKSEDTGVRENQEEKL